MLLDAIVHNVQFDWKSSWKREHGGEQARDDASSPSSLMVSALREFALLHSAQYSQQGGGARQERDGDRVGLTEELEAGAAHALLAQARKQGEADVLLMCCTHLSAFLPPASSPPTALHAEGGFEGVCSGGWWLRPCAVRYVDVCIFTHMYVCV
jgi:hypothetical protein